MLNLPTASPMCLLLQRKFRFPGTGGLRSQAPFIRPYAFPRGRVFQRNCRFFRSCVSAGSSGRFSAPFTRPLLSDPPPTTERMTGNLLLIAYRHSDEYRATSYPSNPARPARAANQFTEARSCGGTGGLRSQARFIRPYAGPSQPEIAGSSARPEPDRHDVDCRSRSAQTEMAPGPVFS